VPRQNETVGEYAHPYGASGKTLAPELESGKGVPEFSGRAQPLCGQRYVILSNAKDLASFRKEGRSFASLRMTAFPPPRNFWLAQRESANSTVFEK
jgi:hypothetical protein